MKNIDKKSMLDANIQRDIFSYPAFHGLEDELFGATKIKVDKQGVRRKAEHTLAFLYHIGHQPTR